MVRITAGQTASPPRWALLQRHLIDSMNTAAEAFVARYTQPDGSLIWRDEWPGMDGSDDGYESFGNFPLFYSLGGSDWVHSISRKEWDAVTRQFTRYGQVYREFDGYYDWMHHGECYTYSYFFGLADPTVQKDRDRALKFAAMYMGEDPDAQNWDPQHRLIRSPINGSRGPRFENSAIDWVTHRPILANYPPPFEDIPGVDGPLCDWNDDAIFAEVLKRLNARMMRGDVPLNLASTSLMTHAYAYTGDDKYKDWVLEYTAAWRGRQAANGGIVPDNVGLNGRIGEHLDGKWYGGYYGYRWPHGINTILEPLLISASNCVLLTGDTSWLDFPRSQIDRIMEQGEVRDGVLFVPHRHGNAGWYDFRAMSPRYLVQLYTFSRDPQDRERLDKLGPAERWTGISGKRGKGDQEHAGPWLLYTEGGLPEYPERILEANHAELQRRLRVMWNDTTTVDEQDVHHWQNINPVSTEALVQLTLGGPQFIYHGGLLHVRVRWFDPGAARPGLPPDVAALVERVTADGLTVRLVNLDQLKSRRVILQAGAFAEHRVRAITVDGQTTSVGDKHVELEIACGSEAVLDIAMDRYQQAPSYGTPWAAEA